MTTNYLGSALNAQVVAPRFTEAEKLRRQCQALALWTRRANDRREQEYDDWVNAGDVADDRERDTRDER